MKYYLFKDGKQMGPFSLEQVKTFLAEGSITAEDQLREETWSSWLQVKQVPGIEAQGLNSRTVQLRDPLAQSDSQPVYAQGKEPVIACVLSLLIVGTGQFYNGEWGKGCFLLVTCSGASTFSCGTMWLVWATVSAIDAYRVAAKLKPLNSWHWWS